MGAMSASLPVTQFGPIIRDYECAVKDKSYRRTPVGQEAARYLRALRWGEHRVTCAFVGVMLQLAGDVLVNLRTMAGCADCRKGSLCARCLASSEAIHPPKSSERSPA